MPFFDYELPEQLIAQQPAARRDESRLLVVRRSTGALDHRVFHDLPELLASGDLLILNDTRVLPARLLGQRDATGGKWEGLFLQRTREGLWELMTRTRGRPTTGESFSIAPGFRLILRGRTGDHHWLMEPEPIGEPAALLERFGRVPLPPYIRKGLAGQGDAERYQTVFADRAGSVAAPTAGLHFTPELIEQMNQGGVGSAKVTLHVGLGTFAPIKEEDPSKHRIHREWCEATGAACEAIRACRAQGGRVVAVGTTAVRTMETAARQGDSLEPFSGETDLFIHPPFPFRAIDAMITNFHLPRTTLLLLVGAFAGETLLRRAYEEAIRHDYRFYSYGDAMLIL